MAIKCPGREMHASREGGGGRRNRSRMPRAAVLLRGLRLAFTLALCGCGREVAPVIPEAVGPVRLVSLAPSLTEIVFAVGAGDRLVGRTDVCDWPPEAAAVPVVGSFGRPVLDALLRQRPTLVLTTDLEDEAALGTLERYGIAHRRIPCNTLDEIAPALREVGRLAGEAAAGWQAGDALAAELVRLRGEAAWDGRRPSVFVEIWGDPLMTAGRRSFVAELVRLAGGSNLADTVDADYFTVSPEWVVARDPEMIFCLYMSRDTQAVRRVAQRVGWQSVRAVRADAVYDGFSADLLFRPGPRVLDGVAELRARLRGRDDD